MSLIYQIKTFWPQILKCKQSRTAAENWLSGAPSNHGVQSQNARCKQVWKILLVGHRITIHCVGHAKKKKNCECTKIKFLAP